MEKIAVIGMGCHFPGSRNVEEFWHALIQGNNTTSAATALTLARAASSPKVPLIRPTRASTCRRKRW